MTRRAAKVDGNQQAIIDAFVEFGCSVRSTAAIGEGFPDLAVGVKGHTFLVEVKDPKQAASDRKLTPKQKRFHAEWKGRVHLVETAVQAVMLAQHYCK